MEEYCKIQTIFKRDMRNKGRIIETEYACPEFEYLKDNEWVFTEKVDGTNIRVLWYPLFEGQRPIRFGGRTDRAQIPVFLYDKLTEMFTPEKFRPHFSDPMVLYGEGYGAKIQKGGKYIPDGVDFVLFDVNICGWWLRRDDIEDIAGKLDIDVVPIVGRGTLAQAVEMTRTGINSQWGDFMAEGLVIKPAVELRTREGERVITKIKHRDFL